MKTTFRNWNANNATFRAAALAYFMVMPLPSLLVITSAIFTEIYGKEVGSHLLIEQIASVAGPTVAQLVGELLTGATSPLGSTFGLLFTLAFMVSGAIGAFVVLQDSLNLMWGVKLPGHASLKEKMRERILPFFLVLGLTTLVIVFSSLALLLLNSIGTGLRSVFGILASGFDLVASLLASFGLAVALFAIIYREVPHARVAWRDVSMAAIISGVIFTVLNNLFGVYLHSFRSHRSRGPPAR
jgi:membrane protein